MRLREHGELRAALLLSSVPDYTTVYRFLRRLPDDTIENVLGESVRHLRRSSRRGLSLPAIGMGRDAAKLRLKWNFLYE